MSQVSLAESTRSLANGNLYARDIDLGPETLFNLGRTRLLKEEFQRFRQVPMTLFDGVALTGESSSGHSAT